MALATRLACRRLADSQTRLHTRSPTTRRARNWPTQGWSIRPMSGPSRMDSSRTANDIQTNIRFLADIVRYGLDSIPSFRMTETFEQARINMNKNAFDKRPCRAHEILSDIRLRHVGLRLGGARLVLPDHHRVGRTSRDCSAMASAWFLNPMTTQQIRAIGFGSDTRTDQAVDASTWPMWLGKGYTHLPEVLGAEMQATSDAAVSKVVPKFRAALGKLVSATGPGEDPTCCRPISRGTS